MHPGLTLNNISRLEPIKTINYQEPRVKSEDFFLENIHFRKNNYLFRKFQTIFVRKNLYPGPHIALITPAS